MFEFLAKLGKEEVVALNRFHLFKKNGVLIYLMALVVGAMFCLPLIEKDITNKLLKMIIVFVLAYLLFVFLINKLMVWLQLRTTKFISEETKTHFKFDDDEFECSTFKPDMKSTTQSKWNLLYKAYESKAHYFLYIS